MDARRTAPSRRTRISPAFVRDSPSRLSDLGAGTPLAVIPIAMNNVTAVTFDRLRWWIVAAAVGAAVIFAASLAGDVTVRDVAALDDVESAAIAR